MVNSEAVLIRPAITADAPKIASIYNEGIRSRAATFKTRERTVDDILAWFTPAAHPIPVAESDGEVLGWIATSTYRPRECYAGVAEFSVYVSYNAHEHGVGSAHVSLYSGLYRWRILEAAVAYFSGKQDISQSM